MNEQSTPEQVVVQLMKEAREFSAAAAKRRALRGKAVVKPKPKPTPKPKQQPKRQAPPSTFWAWLRGLFGEQPVGRNR